MATERSESGRTETTVEWGVGRDGNPDGSVTVTVKRDGRKNHHFNLNRELELIKEE